MEFKKFLEKSIKGNGEKFLPKTIDLYNSFVVRYQTELSKKEDNIEELIQYMNIIIKSQRNPYIKASFRQYLFFIGVQEEDERLGLLKSSKKRASALNSLRMLGEKVIQMRDLKLLFASVEDEWKLIIGFLYDSACRESEMLSLKWRDIIFYDEVKNNISAEATVLGKGAKIRSVFISKTTADLLLKLRPDIEDNDLVFTFRMDDGKLYARQEKALIDGIKKRTLKFIGKAHSPHNFRHTKLTHLSENGANIVGISSIAGHSDIATTNIYVKGGRKEAESTYQNFTESL